MNGMDGMAICLKRGCSLAEILDDLGSTAYYGAMVDSLVGKRYPTGRMGSKTDFSDFGCNQWAKGGISESRKCF